MLAERAILSVKTIAALERGSRRSPYRGTVAALADALDLSDKARASLESAATRSYRPSRVGGRSESPPHNIPAQLSSFVGRENVVAEVAALVGSQRMVTLTGTGGVGKTRLALRVAEHVLPRWTGGVWFVDLATIEDPSRVGERTASALGLDQTDARPASERVISALRGQHLLLVLDNCEHVLLDAARLIAAVLSECRRVSVLATSRERLNIPGERAYSVPPLAVPGPSVSDLTQAFDAVRLFVERARAVAPFALDDSTAPVVADICRRLDGIPLAIELAAVRVRELSVHDIARNLHGHFRLLVGGARTSVARQRTMRAAIDWSVDALSPQQCELFRRVGVFAGGWTLDAAAKVCGDASDVPFDVLDRLSSLVEKSLIIADTSRVRTRYRLLESTRFYALELLDVRGEHQEAASRHARHFATYCDEAAAALHSTQLARWLADLGEELENVRAALAWALSDEGDEAIALRLASGPSAFWRFTGLSHEGRRWLEAALARGAENVEPRIVANAWRSLADLELGARSLEAAQRAVAIDERLGDPLATAQSLRTRGLSLVFAGRFAEAEADIAGAISLLRKQGLLGTRPHANKLSVLALALRELGRVDEAREALETSLSVYTDLGDELLAATAQGNLAELAFYAGDDRRAVELARTATMAWRLAGNATGQSIMYTNLSAYCLALGDISGACQAAKEALILAQHVQLTYTFYPSLQHLATVATLNGDAYKGALLIGYVDARARKHDYQRETTEQRTYSILMRTLEAALPARERARIIAKGARLTEEHAIELALAVD